MAMNLTRFLLAFLLASIEAAADENKTDATEPAAKKQKTEMTEDETMQTIRAMSIKVIKEELKARVIKSDSAIEKEDLVKLLYDGWKLPKARVSEDVTAEPPVTTTWVANSADDTTTPTPETTAAADATTAAPADATIAPADATTAAPAGDATTTAAPADEMVEQPGLPLSSVVFVFASSACVGSALTIVSFSMLRLRQIALMAGKEPLLAQ